MIFTQRKKWPRIIWNTSQRWAYEITRTSLKHPLHRHSASRRQKPQSFDWGFTMVVGEEPDPEHQTNPALFEDLNHECKKPRHFWRGFDIAVGEEPDPEHQANTTLFEKLNSRCKKAPSFLTRLLYSGWWRARSRTSDEPRSVRRPKIWM